MESAACSSFHTPSGMATPVRRYESALTSNSSNSKPAPAARRTLIASGTTSLPAPSQGRTAMCLGRSGLPLAQLVTLDLARDRLRQLGHELDDVRVLIALQPRLAVLLELRRKCIAPRPALGDHEGLDPGEAFDLDPDDGALVDGWVLEQNGLDLDRRCPQATHLDHVVRAALVPIEAVRVDAIPIPGEEPIAEDGALRALVLCPVERERAVSFYVEVASLARRGRLAFVVQDLQLVAGHR